MSDIFISYAREDRDRAEAIAQALEKLGFTVWYDRKIPPGRTFDEVIQEALDEAKCVIVLWSKASVESNFVKEEAEKGRDQGILVPVLVDDVQLPLGFGRLQTANLVHWRGGRTHDEFKELSRSVAQILGGELDSRRMELVRPLGDEVESETEAGQQTAEEEAQREAEAARRKDETEARQKLEAERKRADDARIAEGVQPPERPAAAPRPLYSERRFSPTIAVLTVALVASMSAAGYFFVQHGTMVQERNAAVQDLEGLAVQEFKRLQARENDAKVSDAELVAVYEEFSKNYSFYLSLSSAKVEEKEVAGKIRVFREAAAAFEKLKQRDDPNSPTPVRERLALWKDFQPKRSVSAEAAFKRARVARLGAEVALEKLRAGEADATVSDADLASDYEKFLETYTDHLNSTEVADVESKIKVLSESAETFAKLLKQRDDPNSVTLVSERLALWRKYRPARDESPEAKEKGTRVAALEQDLERLKAETAQQLAELQRQETDATVSDAELVAAYEKFLKTHRDYLSLNSAKVEEVTGKIKVFKASAAAFEKRKRRDDPDSLTVRQRLALWKDFQPKRPVSAEAAFKRARVAELEQDLGRLKAETAQQLAELRARETDAAISDAELVAAYKAFRSKYGGGLDSANTKKVIERIKEFETSAAAFDNLKQRDESEPLTVSQRLTLWEDFQPRRPVSLEAKFKADRVAVLKQELEQ